MKRKFTPYIYILFFCLVFQKISAQKFELNIAPKDSLNISFLTSISFQNKHNSEESIYIELDSISKKLTEFGFLENNIDSLFKIDSVYTAKFNLGRNTEVATIFINPNYLKEISLKDLNLENNQTVVLISEIPNFINSIILSLGNNGFPFAQASLRNIKKQKQQIIADLHIETFKERTIDNIIIKGYENFPEKFLQHYLNLKIDSKFKSEELIVSSGALNSLPFASELKSPEVLFEKDSTSVYLYIEKRKNNTFDGLLGFSTNESGKLELNGYLDLQLSNVFNKGESFSINWKSNGNERTSFNLTISTPFIFNLPFTPSATLNIYKQDSTFINIKGRFDLAYFINSQNSIAGIFRSESSNNLLNDIQSNNTIEEFKNQFFGLAYTYRKQDEFYFYKNKFYSSLNLLWGNRTTTTNSLNETQKRYELELYYNWNLNRRNAIYLRNTSGMLISENYLINELYRIGGSNSIRGFDEESIFSSTYSVFNLEYRYQLNLTSHLYSISDYAYTQNNASEINSNLYGFGLGYSYGTKSGIIDISYAIGKNNDLPFDFNNARFHIKLIQVF